MPQPLDCFFLRPPVELRSIVYDFVFDEHTLHIGNAQRAPNSTLSNQRIFHRLCVCEKIGFKEARELSNRPIDFDSEFNRVNAHYHAFDPWRLHYRCLLPQNTETYSMTLVKTCRQVYEEAILIPYQKNTFSFDDPETLKRFLMCQTPISRTVELAQTKRQAIRKLQLHTIYINWRDVDEWNTTSYDVVKYLKGLQLLDLCIDLAFHDCRVFSKIGQTDDFFAAFHGFPLRRLLFDVVDPSFGIYVMKDLIFQQLQHRHRLSFMAKDNLRRAITKAIRRRPADAIGLKEMEHWES